MQFTDIANSKRPLAALVEFALATKGVTVTKGTIDRYASLLDAAIRADDGEPIDHTPWSDFVSGLDGNKYEAAVRSVASALGASSSEVEQFFAVSNAVIEARSGASVEEVEAELAAELEVIQPTEPALYEHLDQNSKVFREELDRAFGAPDPARPEPDHLAEESGGAE
jgi:hypothetical protein